MNLTTKIECEEPLILNNVKYFCQIQFLALLPNQIMAFNETIVPQLKNYDLKSLRQIVTGGAKIPVPILADLRQALPYTRVVNCYGE